MYQYRAEITNVVDADTLDLLVDLGFRHTVRDRFRLYGINAWEVRGDERPKGLLATAAVEHLIKAHGPAITIRTHQDRRGKYGRWLADVWWLSEGLHLNEWLVREGHARHQQF